MNIVLLTAGGVGNRMGQDIPKQFMSIDNKPVIIYTLESFQKIADVDAIAIICLKGWDVILQAYANQYNITKLKWIFEGSDSNQHSIRNGVIGLYEAGCKEDDIVLVHDGVRPLVSERIIRENIETAKKYGYAVTGLQCKEVILRLENGCVHGIDMKRENLIRTQTPHTYPLGKLLEVHKKADERGIDTAASCELFAQLGVEDQRWVRGSEKNGLKLTNLEDIELFKSLLHTPEETWTK